MNPGHIDWQVTGGVKRLCCMECGNALMVVTTELPGKKGGKAQFRVVARCALCRRERPFRLKLGTKK
jgi:hypothetical protein